MTAMDLLREAAKHKSCLYLTKQEVTDLADYLDTQHKFIDALETDIINLRSANADWANTCADTRDELARLHTYTRGALAQYAKKLGYHT